MDPKGWLSEFELAFFNRPRSRFIAWHEGSPIGFSCYDATAPELYRHVGAVEIEGSEPGLYREG